MKIRKAVLADAKGIAKVHVDSWRSTYANILPDEYLNNLSYEGREKLWENNMSQSEVYVAENLAGEIVGFSMGGRERSEKYKDFTGELYAIYVLKEYQGQGIGKMLVRPIIEDLIELQIFSMLVLVLEKNDSRYFYEALGANQVDVLEIVISGTILNEIVYGWNDIRRIDLLSVH